MQNQNNRPQPRRLVTYGDLATLGVTYCKSHIHRLEALGRFPLRVKLSPNKVAWDLDEVLRFIEDRVSERAHRRYGEH